MAVSFFKMEEANVLPQLSQFSSIRNSVSMPVQRTVAPASYFAKNKQPTLSRSLKEKVSDVASEHSEISYDESKNALILRWYLLVYLL